MRRPSSLHLVALACACLLACAGCASSTPAKAKKGKRSVLLTTYDDSRAGRESSKTVAAELGLLDDPELEAYVSRIGRKLLRGVPRRSFDYQFKIVDQEEPNAFALPGGYIFISRGLLALANSEDELANVIGHEITHAAKRHAAAQQEIARRGSPIASPWLQASNIAAYGRDMERTADRGGQMLAAAAGYDPMGMSTFLRSLEQMERLRIGRSRTPSFLDTHPGARERAATNAARAREIRWKRDPSLGDTHASYLSRIDGIAVGPRPQGGVFVEELFLHPDLDFQIRFPRGWRTSNTNRAVGAVSPRGDALVFLTADLPSGEPQAVAEQFVAKTLEEEGPVEVKASEPVKIGHIDAWRMQLEGGGRGGQVTAIATFIPFRGSTWRVMGVAPSFAAKSYRGRILSTARSFRPLSEEERRSIQGMSLRLVNARADEALVALGQRTGNAWDPTSTAVYNGLLSDHRFAGGERVKIARVEAYTPPDAELVR